MTKTQSIIGKNKNMIVSTNSLLKICLLKKLFSLGIFYIIKILICMSVVFNIQSSNQPFIYNPVTRYYPADVVYAEACDIYVLWPYRSNMARNNMYRNNMARNNTDWNNAEYNLAFMEQLPSPAINFDENSSTRNQTSVYGYNPDPSEIRSLSITEILRENINDNERVLNMSRNILQILLGGQLLRRSPVPQT